MVIQRWKVFGVHTGIFVTMVATRFITLFLFISLTILVLSGLSSISVSSESKPLLQLEATGSNIFQCAFNGQVWEEHQVQADLSHEDGLFYLSLWMGDDFTDRVAFVIETTSIKPGVYELNDPSKRYIFLKRENSDCTFTSDNFYSGVLIIRTFNTERNIVAGTFEFMAHSENCNEVIRVNQGQFDLTYRAN